MDAKQFVDIPRRVGAVALVLLGLMVVVGIVVVAIAIGSENSGELVQVALTVVQVAGSGLVVALVAFYSFRRTRTPKLKNLTQEWLAKDLCEALVEIGTPEAQGQHPGDSALVLMPIEAANVEVRAVTYNLYFYRIFAKSSTVTFCVRLKVKEVLVHYFFPVGNLSQKQVQEKLSGCFSVSSKVGYQMMVNRVSTVDFDERAYYQFTLQLQLKDDFLVDSIEKLFLAQDISSMTHSVLLEAKRNKLPTYYKGSKGEEVDWLVKRPT